MTKGILFGLALLFCTSGLVLPQCLKPNDIIVNETRVGDAIRNLVDGSTQFSVDLLRTLATVRRDDKDSPGIFFSPHSIWSALIVTYMGSMGATEHEMRNVLGLKDMDKVTTWENFRNIRNWNTHEIAGWAQQLFNDHKRASYHSANRIYFQKGLIFKNCMREMLDKEIAFVDFLNSSREVRNEINTWIENETQQRIKDLIPDGGIQSQTRMVVANAVYFKESWLQSFDPQKTAPKRFTTKSRKDILVDMMNTRGRFLYGKSEELQCYALELPYTGNSMSMVILLPRNRFFGVDSLVSNLTSQRLWSVLNEMYPREVVVSIPKFRMEDNFELSTILEKMGLRTLFDPRRVDLSGFTGQREFKVDAVHHKSFIDVNEEGTEAAGATAIISSRTARPLAPASFYADYPFVYFIRDNLSNVILFLGTMEKPPEHELAQSET